MKKKINKRLKQIRTGLRLNTPSPKIIKSIREYSRRRNKRELEFIKELNEESYETFKKNINREDSI